MSKPVELRIDSLDEHDIRALKSLSTGTANEGQQKLALAVICRTFSQMDELAYVPGNPNAGAFLAGRAFVGQQIRKHITNPIEILTQEKLKDV